MLYYPANISASDQSCFSFVDQRCRWSDVENETKSDVGFLTLHNVDTTSVPDGETTLRNVETTLHNVGTMLIQRYFNLASTLVKAILNPIRLVMIVDC